MYLHCDFAWLAKVRAKEFFKNMNATLSLRPVCGVFFILMSRPDSIFGWTVLLSSCSVMSNSLQPRGLQHARLPCPSPSPRACSNSGALSQWCHPTISSSVVPFSSCLYVFPTITVFSNEWVPSHQVAKYWSFSTSSECSGLISFRIDWFDRLAVEQ